MTTTGSLQGLASVVPGPGLADHDERWLRLALVIHEASTSALTSPLDKAISAKHADLACKSFEEKLNVSLLRNETPLGKCLFAYEFQTVFTASGCPGTYESFDVVIICKLIKYFVGKTDWKKENASRPGISNLHNFDLANASQLALVQLLKEYRNFVFHHPGSPALTADEFDYHWRNVELILEGLGYDINNVRCFKSGPLDYGSRCVVQTLSRLIKEAINSLEERLVSGEDMDDFRQLVSDRFDCIERWFRKLQADMLVEEDRKELFDKFEKLQSEVPNKEEFKNLQERVENLHTAMVFFKQGMLFMERKVKANEDETQRLKVELSDTRATLDELRKWNAEECALKEAKQRAQEACWSVNDSILRMREQDGFCGLREDDLVVSLASVDGFADDCFSMNEFERALNMRCANVKTMPLQDVFQGDKLVLVSGHHSIGKSTLCLFILKEWRAGRLWKELFDFVFYINVPLLDTLLKEPPFIMETVLKALYPNVFTQISYEELSSFKVLIIVDTIDCCNSCELRVCRGSLKEAVRKIIVSPESFRRIIVGRTQSCNELKQLVLKGVEFQFVEVIGFTSVQLKMYVDKFCARGQVDSENLWRRISDNDSHLALARFPIFANVLCNVLSEKSNEDIKTQTEMYVWSYFLYLSRHFEGQQGGRANIATVEMFFNDECRINALVKMSKMAFENATTGKLFFEASECHFSDEELDLISPLIVRHGEYLSFSNLFFIKFLSAVHLLVTRTPFGDLPPGDVHLPQSCGVFIMLSGMYGAVVRNSNCSKIIRDFIRPLISKFNLDLFDRHPFRGEIGKKICKSSREVFYLKFCFEIQNGRLLKDTDLYWEGKFLCVSNHIDVDPVCFFIEHFFSKKRMTPLSISFRDDQSSVNECEKLRNCLELHGCHIDDITLGGKFVTEEIMNILSPALCLISRVRFLAIEATDSCWTTFLCAVQNAKRNGTLRIDELKILGTCTVPQSILDELKTLTRLSVTQQIIF